jgi:hypothetical protein
MERSALRFAGFLDGLVEVGCGLGVGFRRFAVNHLFVVGEEAALHGAGTVEFGE